MFGYYFNLAVRSLRGNVVLTVLMIAAIGVGIGASMTTLTIFRAMSGDPIPEKSSRLFVPQIDNYGPGQVGSIRISSDQLPTALTYTDAVALMRAHAAERQAAMYTTSVTVASPNPQQLPFEARVRASYADFFAMFDVPFEYGAPWRASDGDARAAVVVLSRELNDKLFGGANSVGRTVTLDNEAYRVAGVIFDWNPIPRFYNLDTNLGGPEQIFMPFTTAIARGLQIEGSLQCLKSLGTGKDAILHSECVWVQFWVELPTTAAVRSYRSFLTNYAAEQRELGRFNWPPRVALRNVRQWLAYRQVVPNDVSLLVLCSFAFLLTCLLNGVGLMLAKFMARAPNVCIRRALGAGSGAIVKQCLVEAGLVGFVSGLVGLGVAMLGLLVARGLFPPTGVALTRLDRGDVVIAVALSIAATLLAGLYPTWRATQVQPAWQLKAQ